MHAHEQKYRNGLSGRGALDADAMAAIRDRQDYLARKEGVSSRKFWR